METAQAILAFALVAPSQEKLAFAQAKIDSAESGIHVLESHIKQLNLISMTDGIVLEGLIELFIFTNILDRGVRLRTPVEFPNWRYF